MTDITIMSDEELDGLMEMDTVGETNHEDLDDLAGVNEEELAIIGEVQEVMDELSSEYGKLQDSINDGEPLSKDTRPMEERMSSLGKIDKMHKQREIIMLQLEDPEGFTYDEYLDFIRRNTDKDNNYSPVGYYIGSQLEDDLSKMTDEDKICNFITLDSLDSAIEQTRNSIGLKHLAENLRIRNRAFSSSEVNSKIKRTMRKLQKRPINDTHMMAYQLSLDIPGVRDVLVKMAPNEVVSHNKFIYSFCQYIDKFQKDYPVLIAETINNIKYLDLGESFKQNEETIVGINDIYSTI